MPDSLRLYLVIGGVLIAGAVAFVAAVGGFDSRPLTVAEKRAQRAAVGGPFPLELRSPQVLAGTSERVLVALGRPSLGDLQARSPQSAARQRAYVRSLHREERALMSALDAKGVRFGRPVLFARVWSGFAATIATKDLPAVQTLGLRVEPVSRFYPAQVAAKEAPAVRPLPTTAKRVGPVAVLDAFPGHNGARRLRGERAGLRLDAVLRAELPAARIRPIHTAESQPLETGKFDVYATTDQLLAAIERAVDPDQNGDTSDAIPVALTGLSAPYSGFADSPACDAADAAAALGTLLVAPAGNGGQADGPFGTIGAPGAARGALAVGALDGSGTPAPASSRGPTYELAPKPDLAIGGGAKTGAGAAWGTAIAAARVAGVAAALRAERPGLSPGEVAAALIGTAASRGDSRAAGGGDPLLQAARATQLVAEPPQLVLRPGKSATLRLVNLSNRTLLTSGVPAPRGKRHIRLYGPHGLVGTFSATTLARGDWVHGRGIAAHGSVRLRLFAAPGLKGPIKLGPIAIPVRAIATQPPPPPIGVLRIAHRKGHPYGVRFTAGSIRRGAQGRAPTITPVGNLVLTIEGPARRELTPPGGARDLLPGEYAYTLTGEILGTLPHGRYRFVVRARGTAGGAPVVRRSRFFRI